MSKTLISKRRFVTDLITIKRSSSILNPFVRCYSLSKTTNQESSKLSYVSSKSNYSLSYETIAQRLDKAAELYPLRDAHVFAQTNQRISFRSLKTLAEDLAAGLLALGLKKGDRVGVWAPNCAEWVIAQFATAIVGLIQVNVNPAYRADELLFALNKVQCKAIIMSEKFKTQDYIGILSSICPELSSSQPGKLKSARVPSLKHVIVISESDHAGCFKFKDVLDFGDPSHRNDLAVAKSKTEPSDAINIQYTSGTTGSPKGVTLSHHMILNNASFLNKRLYYDKKDVRLCLPLPLYHCFAMVLGSFATICDGITAVYPSDSFSGEACLRAIQNEKCTSMYGTPTMFIDCINHPKLKSFDLSSLELATMGGSVCPPEVLRDCNKKMGVKTVMTGYGMTEASPLITLNAVDDTFENRTETIGKAIEHVEIKVVNANGITVPVGQPGELLVRGFNTMIGYWEDEAKTKEVYTSDRFLKTGDIVTLSEEGYVKFITRLKELIIRGGENIYPREIEDFLHAHEKVADVYVVGVPDKRMGEEICACIRPVANQTISPEELKEFCKNKISHFKIPKYFLFMDQFPMTVTGKIQKNILREICVKKVESLESSLKHIA